MNHDQHGEIMRAIGSLEATVEGTNTRLDKVNGRLDLHQAKIGKMELAFAKFGGMIIAGTAILTFVWNAAGSWVKMKIGL